MTTSLKSLFYLIFSFIVLSCKKDDITTVKFTEQEVNIATHRLTTYSTFQNTKYLIVFESGLGDDNTVWDKKKVASPIAGLSDVLLYDRAGYGKSGISTEPRTISRLSSEVEKIIDFHANGRSVILVGHSLGGMIIREYAIKNPSKVAALIFVDASHEMYNNPTQNQEDMIYDAFKDAYGQNFGGTLEARELIENSQYMRGLSNITECASDRLDKYENR